MIWPQAFDVFDIFSVVLCRFLGRRMERRFIASSEKKQRSNRMHEEKLTDAQRLVVRAAELAHPPHNLGANLGPFCPFLIRLKACSL